MSLTYQPFAETSEINNLRRDLAMNVSEGERVLSSACGIGLIVAGFAREGFARWALLALGGAFVRRGVTGHCPLYQQIEQDRRHARSGVPGNRGTRVEAAIEIACRPETLFGFWRNLEQIPRVMRHVRS